MKSKVGVSSDDLEWPWRGTEEPSFFFRRMHIRRPTLEQFDQQRSNLAW